MALGVVEVSTSEYNKLLELKGKVASFEAYVKEHDYIDKKDCAMILGFKLVENKKGKKENAGTDRE